MATQEPVVAELTEEMRMAKIMAIMHDTEEKVSTPKPEPESDPGNESFPITNAMWHQSGYYD